MTSIMHISEFLCIFNRIYAYYVYIFPVIMSFNDYLSVRLCVFTMQKIDQAGGPETFFNFVWPKCMQEVHALRPKCVFKKCMQATGI